MEIFERFGKVYRRIGDQELIQPGDMVAWKKMINDDPQWYRAEALGCCDEPHWYASFAFLRELDPLIGQMLKVKQNENARKKRRVLPRGG